MSERKCMCGVPSKANVYVMVIYGPKSGVEGDTDYTDGYYCASHKPKPRDLVPDGFKVLEWKRKKLR